MQCDDLDLNYELVLFWSSYLKFCFQVLILILCKCLCFPTSVAQIYFVNKFRINLMKSQILQSSWSSLLSLWLLLPVTPYSPYWILSTDYTSLSVVYSCTDILRLFHVDYAWILGRSRFLPPDTVRYAKELLISEGIDLFRMKATDQMRCKDN